MVVVICRRKQDLNPKGNEKIKLRNRIDNEWTKPLFLTAIVLDTNCRTFFFKFTAQSYYDDMKN